MMHARTRIAALLAVASLGGCSCNNTLANKSRYPDGGTGGRTGGSSGSSGTHGTTGTSGTSGTGSTTGTTGTSGSAFDGGTAVGPGTWNVAPDAGDEGVGQDPDSGYLTLNASDVRNNFAWIAANPLGYVSKIDTDSSSPTYLHEIARYYTVVPRTGAGTFIPSAQGLRPTLDPSPSRTVIDPDKNVWIANRAPGGFGSATKIANFKQDCVDRNGNGVIDTSSDKNGDGIISMNPADGEMIIPTNPEDPNTYDECVLFTQPFGTQALVGGSTADVAGRAITVDQTGDVWAGDWHDSTVFHLDKADGHLKGQVAVPIPTYGGVTDSAGRLWFVDFGNLEMIEPATGTVYGPSVNAGGCSCYGVAVDGRDRIWNAGIGAENCAARFTPGAVPGLPDGGLDGVWDNIHFDAELGGEAYGRGRGIAADNQGIVWQSADQQAGVNVGRLVGLYADDGGLFTFPGGNHVVDYGAVGTLSIGVGLDATNDIWINTYAAGTTYNDPTDPNGNLGKAVVVHRADGGFQNTKSIANGLYTYSDFTGYANAHFTAPNGHYRRVFPGCGPTAKTRWKAIAWTATIPTGTSLGVGVRAADTNAALPGAELFGLYTDPASSPKNLLTAVGASGTVGVPPTHFLEVDVQLASTVRGQTPALKSLSVSYECVINQR
jgi:hypothetical protein